MKMAARVAETTLAPVQGFATFPKGFNQPLVKIGSVSFSIF
jgi:hypothetical protein